MWAGEYDPNQEKPFGREKLDELRKLFFEGKLIEGNGIAGRELVEHCILFGTHLPIGDLKTCPLTILKRGGRGGLSP